MGSAEAASASEPRAEDGVQPHSHIQVQTVPWQAHSPSLICQEPLHKEKSLIVEMEAETSLRFQSNELGPHPVAN